MDTYFEAELDLYCNYLSYFGFWIDYVPNENTDVTLRKLVGEITRYESQSVITCDVDYTEIEEALPGRPYQTFRQDSGSNVCGY